MRSVYARIVLWCVGTLILSLVAFFAISRFVSDRAMGKGGPFDAMQRLQMEEAIEAYETGGPQRLAAYLAKLQRLFGVPHRLTDAAGRDLVTSEDRSATLALIGDHWGAPRRGGAGHPDVFGRKSPDGRYRFLIQFPPPLSIWNFVPYYLLILVAIALLSWILAMQIASPLKRLARIVRKFGAGDLGARVQPHRRDEIGDVGRAFDEMAERIETLLTAERRLLQDVSHELRSPLARLSFAAELVRTAPNRDAAVARMKKEIQRLTDLVGALLEVTRLEGDPSTRKLDPVQLDELLRELVEDCRMEASAHGCKLELRGLCETGMQGDRELLRRAFENVIRNAIRFAPPGSPVEVSVDANGAGTSISVRDYGPGVPEDVLADIFRPFFRADASRTGSTGGVGLGLAIAERAVHLHHGQVHAENANPGLRVRIVLP